MNIHHTHDIQSVIVAKLHTYRSQFVPHPNIIVENSRHVLPMALDKQFSIGSIDQSSFTAFTPHDDVSHATIGQAGFPGNLHMMYGDTTINLVGDCTIRIATSTRINLILLNPRSILESIQLMGRSAQSYGGAQNFFGRHVPPSPSSTMIESS